MRLNQSYIKPINEVFARHRLNTCQQNSVESLEDCFAEVKIP